MNPVELQFREKTAVDSDAAFMVRETPSPFPTPGLSTKLERRVRLTAADWAKITWRSKPAIPAEEPRPFHFHECLDQTRAAFTSWGSLDLRNISIPGRLTAGEAWFWLQFLDVAHDTSVRSPDDLEARLRYAQADDLPESGLQEAVKKIFARARRICFEAPQVLLPFFTPIETAALILDGVSLAAGKNRARWRYAQANLHRGLTFARLILPAMEPEERSRFREGVEKWYDAERDASSFRTTLIVTLLALIGGSARVADYVRKQPNKAWSDRWYFEAYLDMLGGLPDEATFVAETRRLMGHLHSPEDLRLWLAATEWRELDFAVESVIAAGAREDVAAMGRVLALVEAPEAAHAMLELQLGSKAPHVGEEWFASHRLHAAVGLVPIAMGNGKYAEAARKHLREIQQDRMTAILSAAVPHLSRDQAEWLRHQVMSGGSSPLRSVESTGRPTKETSGFESPPWLSVPQLPNITIHGRSLTPAQLDSLLHRLQTTSVTKGSTLFQSLKEHADPHSTDRFAVALFGQWQSAGMPPRDRWAMDAVGNLGGDECVRILVPVIRQWPNEDRHQFAMSGLECLRAIGTDEALLSLNKMARRLKLKVLRDRAQFLVKQLAHSRGLAGEQLADRNIPACDLDDDGSRVFDFGPRQFSLVFGPELKPMIRDSDGVIRTDLPTPKESDDAALACSALNDWKRMRHSLREAFKVQVHRLEDAMITGRRWTLGEFRMLLVDQPLMYNLVRLLVFASYDDAGHPSQTFRVDEQRRFIGRDGKEISALGSARIGVVHPAHLDDAVKHAWIHDLACLKIVPPFSQLDRRIFHAHPKDLCKTEIIQFRGPRIPAMSLCGILERSRWTRETPAESGSFMRHSKYFASTDITAVIQYTGMSIGYYEDPQELESVFFISGEVNPDGSGEQTFRIPISEVDPVVLSEVLRFAHSILSDAR